MQETPGSSFSAVDHDRPALVEFGDHGGDRILRAGERREPGVLRRRVDARPGVDGELADVVVETLRPHRIAHAPPGHGVGLRPAVEQDQPVADLGIGEQRDVREPVVGHLPVDLVGEDRDVGKARQPFDQRVDLRLGGDAAGRVGRRIEDDQPRLGRDQVQRFLGREGEAVLFADRDRHGPRAGELDHRAIDRKSGIGIEDVGAGLAEHQDRREHGDLAARHDHHEVGRHLDAEAPVDVGGDRLAQFLDAGRRRVAVVAVAQRLHRRLDDVLGRAEIGLADAEVDDVAAGSRQLGGAGENRERVLLADPVEAGDSVQQGVSPGCIGGLISPRD